MAEMTIDERKSRDGDRWRYVFFLERELEARKSRRRLLITSLILNFAFGGALIWQAF